jgi:hypothetical protein
MKFPISQSVNAHSHVSATVVTEPSLCFLQEEGSHGHKQLVWAGARVVGKVPSFLEPSKEGRHVEPILQQEREGVLQANDHMIA